MYVENKIEVLQDLYIIIINRKVDTMQLKAMTEETKDYLKALYEEAFPIEERRPFSLLEQEVEQGFMELLVMEVDNVPSGLVFTSFQGELALLEFLAIDEKKRGQGLGSQVLSLLKERYKEKRFFLEIETPMIDNNTDIRYRREQFYIQNGFLPIGVFVLFQGVKMKLLSLHGEKVTFEEYKEHYEKTVGLSYAKKMGIEQDF